MALDWAAFFAPPTGDTGLSNGSFADVDEWPFSDADACYNQNDQTDSFTGFDLSSSPGDKKGFRVWVRMRIQNGSPTVNATFRLLEGGTTELWAGSPVLLDSTSFQTYIFDIPDSAFSGDPAINNLAVEVALTRTAGGNQRTHFSGVRLSKSPFTAAQEMVLPSDFGTPDFSWYRPADLALLGAAADEAVVVWPDASGNGRHLVRQTGTGALYRSGDRVEFASATRLMGSREDPVTGNHIWIVNITPEDTGATQAVWSHANEFVGSGVPGDKNILGIDDAGSGDKFLLMSGDGTGPVHLYGATTVSFDTEYWVTEWIQDAGNEHLWIDDNTTPDVDGASGSNDWLTYSLGNRESDDRPFQGFVEAGGFGIIDGAGITETNINDGVNELVNGAAAEVALAGTAAGSSTASGVLSGEVPLAGAAGGSSSAGGVLSGDVPLVGSSAGLSSASGVLSTDIGLSGSAAASSTAQGVLTGVVPLSGATAGSSVATGGLNVDISLSGASAGTSTASGDLSIQGSVALVGTADGTSTTQGALSLEVGLDATATGTSTAAGTLSKDVPLIGSAAGTSTGSGDLTVEGVSEVLLSGSASGSSTADGLLVEDLSLTGSTDGGSTAAGDLTVEAPSEVLLAGSCTGSSAATANLSIDLVLLGAAAGTSTGAGVLTMNLIRPVPFTPTPVPFTPTPVPHS